MQFGNPLSKLITSAIGSFPAPLGGPGGVQATQQIVTANQFATLLAPGAPGPYQIWAVNMAPITPNKLDTTDIGNWATPLPGPILTIIDETTAQEPTSSTIAGLVVGSLQFFNGCSKSVVATVLYTLAAPLGAPPVNPTQYLPLAGGTMSGAISKFIDNGGQVFNIFGNGPIVGDAAPAINNALSQASNAGGGIVVIPPGRNYVIDSALIVPTNVTLIAPFISNANHNAIPDPTTHPGQLLWGGAANGVMMLVNDATGVDLHSFTLNANGVAGVTGLSIQSDNVPPTSGVTLGDHAIYGCAIAVQVGNHSTSGFDYQCDHIQWGQYAYYVGNGAGSYGVVVDSLNAMDEGQIGPFNFQVGTHAVWLKRTGTVKIKGTDGGALVGVTPAMIRISSGLHGPVLIEETESETTTLDLWIDNTGGGNTSFPVTLIGNVFNNGVKVDAIQYLIGMGNNWDPGGGLNLNAAGAIYLDVGDSISPPVTEVGGALYQRLFPNATSPITHLRSPAEGIILELEALAAASAKNPGIELKNSGPGGGDYDLLVPGTGGLTPGALAILNVLTGTLPVIIDPAAGNGCLKVVADGIQVSGQGSIFTGAGAPTIAGTAGDQYNRTDTPSTANQRIYVCTASGGAGVAVWTGIA